MLVRIACKRCLAAALWTDDPNAFLQNVCRDRAGCAARLTNESQERVVPGNTDWFERKPIRPSVTVRAASARRRAIG